MKHDFPVLELCVYGVLTSLVVGDVQTTTIPAGRKVMENKFVETKRLRTYYARLLAGKSEHNIDTVIP